MSADKIPVVTDAGFDTFVEQAPAPVLVDFYAPWCGPCKTLTPVIEKVAKEFGPKLVIAKMNVDENHIVPRRYGVQSIPMLLLLKNGNMAEMIVGPLGREELKKRIGRHLG